MASLTVRMGELERAVLRAKAYVWRRRGRIPARYGHGAAKWLAIHAGIGAENGGRYGFDDAGIDERVVEYPWAFERVSALRTENSRVLDAGSVLNHKRILARWRSAGLPPVFIVTLAREKHAELSESVTYEFADLRHLPYRDECFDIVLCLSTIEHVGLDNRIYGSAAPATSEPGTEAVRAMYELRRVTRAGGTLLLSVPFGLRSHRGWLRIFDDRDLEQLTALPGWALEQSRFFLAGRDGWRESTAEQARTAGYNERLKTGTLTAPSWVAAAEAVALVELKRTEV